ncbi:hypothetical protein [Bradyrhizobium sp. F1.13.3]|uniref:hypothetical protein n=1 Tax=Bradyrhizobium sp. F1.13.3 TaxID=3156351 RepID=UPI00339194F8
MYIISILIKIASQAYLLKVLLVQTHNFIFIVAARPILWAVGAAMLGLSYVSLAAVLSWDPRIISWVIIVVTILIWPPSPPNGYSNEEIAQFAAECYAEIGIRRGLLKYRIGVLAFALCSAIAYLLAFGEICSPRGECAPFYVGMIGSLQNSK